MPRGRKRQTPTEAWRDSETRILRNLPLAGSESFGDLLEKTKVSPTTLSSHLRRLRSEEKVARDVRTGGYLRTESGNRWLEVSAIVQRIVTLANQAGSVGPGRGGSVLGRATSVCAMPSPGPSALSRVAGELPDILAESLMELLLFDRIKPGVRRRPKMSRVPSTRRTAKLLGKLPRIFIIEVQWDTVAKNLDPETAESIWNRVIRRTTARLQNEDIG